MIQTPMRSLVVAAKKKQCRATALQSPASEAGQKESPSFVFVSFCKNHFASSFSLGLRVCKMFLNSRSPFRILRKVIRDRVPWRAIIDKCMELRPNSRIIIERAHANRHLRTVRPITAEQTGAAVHTERLYGALAFSVNL